MKNILVILSVLLLGSAKADIITKVHDGDTITTATGEIIRLACIDAPEITNNRHGKKDVINGPASKNWLSNQVLNKDVTIKRFTKDLYGRTVALIYLSDGTEINRLSVTTNHSVVYMAKKCDWRLTP
jgi:micrococcal nuclease